MFQTKAVQKFTKKSFMFSNFFL